MPERPKLIVERLARFMALANAPQNRPRHWGNPEHFRSEFLAAYWDAQAQEAAIIAVSGRFDSFLHA